MCTVALRDPVSGHVTVSHPLRRAYYTTVSVVLFFAPLFVMALTYSHVTAVTSSASSCDVTLG